MEGYLVPNPVFPWTLWIWYVSQSEGSEGITVIDEMRCFSEEDALKRMEKLKMCGVERLLAWRNQ